MKAVAGTFASQDDAARAARKLASVGVLKGRINLLFPGRAGNGLHGIPVSEAERPGVGKALGGVVGAAPGVAGGPAGAATLGLAGASVGVAGGGALDDALTQGLPQDEIFVYEDALRQGRSVLIVFADDEAHAVSLRRLMEAEGAESVDAAREQWWTGLRGTQQEHYSKAGRDFKEDEKFYRLGFEAALHAKTRCKEYDQMLAEMTADLEDLQQRYPDSDLEEPFRHGYERGRDYYQSLCGKPVVETKP